MLSRLAGALLRAILVVLLITTPSILLPGTHPETSQVVALVALIAAIFTLMEYNSHYPSLVEFREAPPFNRVRFFSLFACVFFLAIIARGQVAPTG